MLLRSVELDHPDGDSDLAPPIPGFLLGHDCGYPLGLGCTNFGTDWVVRHDGDDVLITDPIVVDVTADPKAVKFDVTVRIALEKYRRQIVAFATEARRFYFADGAVRVSDMPDIDETFWAEFDERLKRAQALEVER